jgi:hypothetical protein
MRRGCSSGRNPCRDGDLKYVWRQDGDELEAYVLDFSEDPGGEEESDRDVARPGSRVDETTRRQGEPIVGCVLTHQESPGGMQIWCVKTRPTRADSNPDTGPFPPNRSCTHPFSRIDGSSTTDSHLSGGPDRVSVDSSECSPRSVSSPLYLGTCAPRNGVARFHVRFSSRETRLLALRRHPLRGMLA